MSQPPADPQSTESRAVPQPRAIMDVQEGSLAPPAPNEQCDDKQKRSRSGMSLASGSPVEEGESQLLHLSQVGSTAVSPVGNTAMSITRQGSITPVRSEPDLERDAQIQGLVGMLLQNFQFQRVTRAGHIEQLEAKGAEVCRELEAERTESRQLLE